MIATLNSVTKTDNGFRIGVQFSNGLERYYSFPFSATKTEVKNTVIAELDRLKEEEAYVETLQSLVGTSIER